MAERRNQERTATRWSGVALAMLLVAPGLVSRPTEVRAAADASVCDANAEPANLALTLKDMNGRDVSLAAYKGQVLLLNFWATWCGPCKIEIPALIELSKKYQPRGLAVLGVSIDDPVAKLKPFAETLKMTYPVLVGEGREDLQKAYPLFGVPNTYLIRRDGRLCTHHTGLVTKEQIEPEIKALL